MAADWEAQLASESSSLGDEARLVFLEEFALMQGTTAKRALVQRQFVPGTPDFWFYEALCVVLELQALTEQQDASKDQQAWRLLGESKARLQAAEQQLSSSGCWRRVQRLQRRRLMLELELSYRMKRTSAEISGVAQAIATALQVNYMDPEPTGIAVNVRKEALPTMLREELLDLDKIIQAKLDLMKFDNSRVSTLKMMLSNLDVFGREKAFQKVRVWDGSDDDRWKLLEVFLDDFAFEYTDIPGYLDLVVEDVARSKDSFKEWSFNFRQAHNNLSFPQIVECAQRAPERFRNNAQFALRGIQLLRAAARVDVSQSSDLRDEVQKAKELQHIATYLEFLRDFVGTAVDGIRAVILYRKLELLLWAYWINPDAAKELLQSLVEYVAVAGGSTLRYFSCAGDIGLEQISQPDHEAIVERSLQMIWSSGVDAHTVASALSGHLEDTFLDIQHALAMIKLNKGNLSHWVAKLPDKGQELSSQASSSALTFCESNPTYFMPDDPIRIFVRTRNVKMLTAHLYEIKTMEYYSRLRREIKGNISIDGLLPTEEQVIDLSHLSTWQEARVPVEFLARQTESRQRGVFVVEVFEKGMTCRAILRKGFLRHVERITILGHEFTVLDEHGNLLRDARALVLNIKSGGSRAQLGREYTADDNGVITVPFRHPNESSHDKFAIAFSVGSFGSFYGSFDYLAESFGLNIDMHIDAEQLLPGAVAQLVTRPRLLVAGIATGKPLDLLVDVSLVIGFNLVNTSNAGSSSHKEIQNFASMQELVSSPPRFEIPMDAEGFRVTVNARLLRLGISDKSELPQVSDSKSFAVQRVNDFNGTYTPHLVRRALESDPSSPNEFRLLVFGHNGESVSDVRVELSFRHVHCTGVINASLQANSSGEIKLGKLENIERAVATFSDGSSQTWSWELPNLRSYRPQIVNCSAAEVVEIPIPIAFSDHVEAWMKDNMVSVCELVGTVLQSALHSSQVVVLKDKFDRPISFAVHILRAGTYVVYVRPLNIKYPITVCEKKNVQVPVPLGLIIQPTQVLLATQTKPLMICSQELKAEGDKKLILEIHLRNAAVNSTRVVVSLKHFLDTCKQKISEVIVGDGLSSVSSSGARLPKLSFRAAPHENDYLKMRMISGEYSYILQRRAFASSNKNSLRFLGQPSLSKPSLLQNPFVDSESDMEVITAEAGDEVTGFRAATAQAIYSGGNSERKAMKRRSQCLAQQQRSGPGSPSMSFLGKQSMIVCSSAVDSNGLVRVDLSDLDFLSGDTGSFEVCTVAIDSESGYVCTQELVVGVPSESVTWAIPKRDIRLSIEEALAPSKHFQQTDSHECVRAGDVKTLSRTFSSKFALYESLDNVIDLWPTLTPGSDVGDLAVKLKGWKRLAVREKLQFYYANACDDFHFFLFRKDQEFFRQYARPLIASKICMSLIDYYVLNDEASLQRFYLAPAAFQRLSSIEKLLLAERLPEASEKERVCEAVIRGIESKYPSGCSSTTLANMFNTILSQGQVDLTAAAQMSDDASLMAFGGFGSAPGGFDKAQYSPSSPSYAPTSSTKPMAFGACAVPAPSASFRSRTCMPATDTIETTTEFFDEDEDFGVRSLDSESDESGDDGNDSERDNNQKTRKVKQETPYIPPGKVRKAQEKRYFEGQHPALFGCNKFWRDYAQHIMRWPDRGFASSYFPEAMTSITEGLFALAVLDLADEANPAEVQLATSGSTYVRLAPANDAILYYRSIGPAESSPTANSELILKQRIRDENNDDCIELVVNKIYTTVVTLSNIGSLRLDDINLLLQIPHGSIPMKSNGFYTKNEITSVEPNHTQGFLFYFYFPSEGVFQQYPARASVGGDVVAWARLQSESSTLKVARTATHVNLASWYDVSARGSLEEVIRFVETTKPGVNIDYGKLFWRCHDDVFFRGLVGFLRRRMVFVSGVWKYGLFHLDDLTMRELFASSDDLAQSIGSGFCSSFVDEERLYTNERFGSAFKRFDHCEFGPFLTRRAHPMMGRVDTKVSWGLEATMKSSGNQILNAEAREYFGGLCQRLGMRTHMDAQNLLVMAFYMILFDRIDKALYIFSLLEDLPAGNKMGVERTVQYAYLDSFLDFFRDSGETERKFDVARRAIAQHAKHPQPRWRQRFQSMQEFVEEYDAFETQKINQLEQMEVIDTPINQTSGTTAAGTGNIRGSQVMLEATVGADAVLLTSRYLGQCEVAFYPIDLELMFSTNPFNISDSTASASSLLLIEPRQRLTVDIRAISSDESKMTVPIPDELVATQMMVRVREISSSRTVRTVSPPIDIIRPFYNSSLRAEIMIQCGMLQVLHDDLPLRSCYIKVYAKVSAAGGRSRTKIEFYKDGYTNLLGKFDYVGINGDLISSVEKFAILISHDKFGASVEQVDPPVLASTVGDFGHQQERELLLY